MTEAQQAVPIASGARKTLKLIFLASLPFGFAYGALTQTNFANPASMLGGTIGSALGMMLVPLLITVASRGFTKLLTKPKADLTKVLWVTWAVSVALAFCSIFAPHSNQAI